jgi:hypothetical protein
MNQATTDRTLFALFCLSRDTRHIDATEIARAAALSPTVAALALLFLERAGLVDASRARLTMSGLARATKLSAAGGGRPSVDLRNAKPRKEAAATPLAAAPEASEPDAHGAEADAPDRVPHADDSCPLQ